MAGNSGIKLDKVRGVFVVQGQGNVTGLTATLLERILEDLRSTGETRIVVDLSKVESMDMPAWSAIMGTARGLKSQEGGGLRVAGTHGRPQDQLAGGIVRGVDSSPSVEAALNALIGASAAAAGE